MSDETFERLNSRSSGDMCLSDSPTVCSSPDYRIFSWMLASLVSMKLIWCLWQYYLCLFLRKRRKVVHFIVNDVFI